VRLFTTIAVAFAITVSSATTWAKPPAGDRPWMITRATDHRECSFIPAAKPADLFAYKNSKLWGKGVKALQAGRLATARKMLGDAWKKISADLAKTFATDQCNEELIAKTLDSHVFKALPDAIPSSERFVPPQPIMLAMATLDCVSGDFEKAGLALLTEHLDQKYMAAAVALLYKSGKRGLAKSFVPNRLVVGNYNEPLWTAVDSYFLALDESDDDALNIAMKRLVELINEGIE